MSKFKPGDRVRLTKDVDLRTGLIAGREFTLIRVDHPSFPATPVVEADHGILFYEEFIELVQALSPLESLVKTYIDQELSRG